MSTCQDCGQRFAGYFVADDVWLTIVGRSGGLLCLNCLHRRAAAKGLAPTVWEVEPAEWRGQKSVASQMCDERAEQEARADRAERALATWNMRRGKIRRLCSPLIDGGAP